MRLIDSRRRRARGPIVALIIVTFFGVPLTAAAQDVSVTGRPTSEKPAGDIEEPFMPVNPVSCESFATLIDQAFLEWQGMQGTFFIVIARSGGGERASLSKARLDAVENYLKRYKSRKYVVAEGGRVNGLGRLEVYVGGNLRTVIPVKKHDPSVCSGKVNPFLGSQ